MQKSQSILFTQEEGKTNISHVFLPDLLSSGQTLALNLETRTLSLLTDGPLLILERQFSANEIRVFVPIVETYPHYCPYEVLLAHLYSKSVSTATVAHCRQRLQEAEARGIRQQELRPIRRALSSLRTKLRYFDLGISNVREMGCSLISLKSNSHWLSS
jgi:hypothetical protein